MWSTQYLRSIDGVTVVDVRDVAKAERIEPVSRASGVTIYQIAPWQLGALRGSLDLFHNAYSFQEMEQNICARYAELIGGIVTGHVWLLSSIAGHLPGAGGQNAPVQLEFLTGLFRGAFPVERRIDYGLFDLYSDPNEQILLSREGG